MPPEDVGIDRAEIVWKRELITLDYMEHHSHGSAVRWTARIVAGVTFLHRRNYQTPNLLSDCDRVEKLSFGYSSKGRHHRRAENERRRTGQENVEYLSAAVLLLLVFAEFLEYNLINR